MPFVRPTQLIEVRDRIEFEGVLGDVWLALAHLAVAVDALAELARVRFQRRGRQGLKHILASQHRSHRLL